MVASLKHEATDGRAPPQRRSRSPRRNFTVDVSDSDDEFGLINYSMQLQFFHFLFFFLLMQLQFQIFPNYLIMHLQFFFCWN